MPCSRLPLTTRNNLYMDAHTIQHNAFTGLKTRERSSLVCFIRDNLCGTGETSIQEAIDVAVKSRPSFGGFILTAYQNTDMVAALVAHQTGMEMCNTTYRLIYAVSTRGSKQAENALAQLLLHAVRQTRGQLSLRVDQGCDILPFYQKLGFQPKYLELQIDPSTIRA